VKNGGGAIMDFGCYGAEWAIWLKGRPARVSAIAQKLKVEQHNKVDDDATIVLEYPDGTAIIEASWNWPYTKGQVEVFGPKGSLLATSRELLSRSTAGDSKAGLQGQLLELEARPPESSNLVAYFVDCIRHDKPIEDPLSMRLNVQVMEILDAARESVRTGKQQELR
jgi:predicted dehydrogenase